MHATLDIGGVRLGRRLDIDQEAVALSRQIGDPEGLVFALADLGLIASAQGNHKNAELLARESLAEARQAQNEMAIAAALHSLGSVLLDSGDYGSARAALTESLALRRARGDKRNVANSLASWVLPPSWNGTIATQPSCSTRVSSSAASSEIGCS